MDAGRARGRLPSREAYIQELRTNPRYYATEPEQLMRETARVTKRSTASCRACSGRCRGSPTRIREIPAETAEGTTTAYYNQGSPESGIAGTYYVNTSQAQPAPLLGGPGAHPARSGARPPSPDRAPAGDGHRALPPQLRLLHRLHRRLGPLCREPGRDDGPLQHARAADGRALLPDVARHAGWWSIPASTPSAGTRPGRSPSCARIPR